VPARHGPIPWGDAVDFWNYSLALYSQPHVAAACLSLQRRRGVNVSVLLLCCWVASRGKILDSTTLARATAAIAAWHAGVVVPLRTARERLKDELNPSGDPQLAAFRETVKACELEAERHEQRRLLAVLGQGLAQAPRSRETALANLLRYAPGADEDILQLADAAFSHMARVRNVGT